MIGTGDYTFEMNANWGKLPEGVKYNNSHAVVVDSLDRVYIHNLSNDAVIVFSPEGEYLDSWGERLADGAHGMQINREPDGEFLYFANNKHGFVQKTTLTGEIVLTLGVPPLPHVYHSPNMYRPSEATVAPNGDIFVSDGYGQHWIHRYNASGEWLHSWGGLGSEKGKMKHPHGIRVDTRGAVPILYVADRANERIQLFTLDGDHISFITKDVRRPSGTSPYQDGVIIVPELYSRVTLLDRNDELIVHLGEDDAWTREGWPRIPASEYKPDRFVSPHAACANSKGDIFVVDWVPPGRVSKLTRL